MNGIETEMRFENMYPRIWWVFFPRNVMDDLAGFNNICMGRGILVGASDH